MARRSGVFARMRVLVACVVLVIASAPASPASAADAVAWIARIDVERAPAGERGDSRAVASRAGRMRACIRFATRPLRVLAHASRTLLVALAAALGAPPPRFIRCEDPVVQVDEDRPASR